MNKIWHNYNIKESSTKEEIKKAYKKICLTCHPDMESGSEELFKEIQKDYEYLLRHKPPKDDILFNSRSSYQNNDFYEIEISFEEMFFGTTKKILFHKNFNCYFDPCKNKVHCTVCGGSGFYFGNLCQECYGSGKMVLEDCPECNGFHHRSHLIELPKMYTCVTSLGGRGLAPLGGTLSAPPEPVVAVQHEF